MVEYQSANILHGWSDPTARLFIFLVSAFAETNRLPSDLPESESELVAGITPEYSSMKLCPSSSGVREHDRGLGDDGDAVLGGGLILGAACGARIPRRIGHIVCFLVKMLIPMGSSSGFAGCFPGSATTS